MRHAAELVPGERARAAEASRDGISLEQAGEVESVRPRSPTAEWIEAVHAERCLIRHRFGFELARGSAER